MLLSAPFQIETVRLKIRLLEHSDLTDLMRVNGDQEVTRCLPYKTWESPADAEAWFDRMVGIQASGTAVQLVIVDKPSAAVIGTCLVFRYDEGSRRAELGYVLAKSHWGAGFMHEALHAVIGHAFRNMGLRRLEAEVDPTNAASTRLLERLGFTREGVLRQRWVSAHGPYDVEVYGLLRHEFADASAGTIGTCHSGEAES
jgi:RimJ/RimL family protein N-acetyltransferase